MSGTRARLFWTVVGCIAAGAGSTGAVAGIAVGLSTYPPTAWAGAVEIGLPAAVVGCVLGLPVAAVATALHRDPA